MSRSAHSSKATGRVITYSFCDSFIDKLADFIHEEYVRPGADLSRLAVVFGGKRPAMFLRRALSRLAGGEFVSPQFFTINEFMNSIVRRKEPMSPLQDMDAGYLLYRTAKEKTPQILEGKTGFAEFLPWAGEILAFFDHLDLEQVDNARLLQVRAAAEIGYAVPDDINRLLKHLALLRGAFHARLKETQAYSRGGQYARAAELIGETVFDEVDQILVCNFFYFNRCEETVMKSLHERGKATFIFQGDERKWPIMGRMARNLGCRIEESSGPETENTRHETRDAGRLPIRTPAFNLRLYSGFDLHSQVGLVREILKDIPNPENTVIVLPSADPIIPLLSEITGTVKDFNISMGYPLRRSSLNALMEFIPQAQLSMKNGKYYAKDYLKVIRHPLVKNLALQKDPAVTRILVHKIEEILTGREKAAISGRTFIDLGDIESSDELFMLTQETLDRLHIDTSRERLQVLLEEIHDLVFVRWQDIRNFSQFAERLRETLDILVRHSFLRHYPLNLNIAEKMYGIIDEFQGASFQDEIFDKEELFRIFDHKIRKEIIAFQGTPLKGLQILGLFETRSLSFENVIIINVNEGIMPSLNIYQPLIPREVMISLDLNRLEFEEEIQRYLFMRLISSAKNVHLVYEESRERERSRFIEELVWEDEKKNQVLNAVSRESAGYAVRPAFNETVIPKTPAIVEFLKNFTYSASSVNTYLRDPVEFYYKYVLGLQEQEDLLDEPEARRVGTFVHELLERAFYPFLGKTPVIDAAFRERFQNMFDRKFEEDFGRSMKSDLFLLKVVMRERLNRFLDREARSPDRHVDKVLYLESRFEDAVSLPSGQIRFKYIVDRVDRMKNGTIMIIDYKTGSIDQMPKAADAVRGAGFTRESILENVRSFQIPLYFHYLHKQFPGDPVNAALYNLRTLDIKTFTDAEAGENRGDINRVYLEALDFIMREIFDPDVPFKS